METKRIILRTNKAESYIFEKINKINKYLAKLTKRKKERIQINKIKD
jgi:hypothetical protein